jgi:hypothetical protein
MLRLFWRGTCPSFLIEPAGPARRQEATAAVLTSRLGSCLHRIQEAPVTELSEPTRKLLDETLDIDAHEMTPSRLWGQVFGEAAGQYRRTRRARVEEDRGSLRSTTSGRSRGTSSATHTWRPATASPPTTRTSRAARTSNASSSSDSRHLVRTSCTSSSGPIPSCCCRHCPRSPASRYSDRARVDPVRNARGAETRHR